uniref:G-protein coupled receptors family 1 profile domain-containing protein n=1 Tax=Sphaeramia orbicularis TaxID=375764 RepID=A0A673AZ89_9TELE
METLEGGEFCFPQLLNISCRKPVQHHAETVFLYILLSSISLLTVTLNLLVVISISHFRQLHTSTNLLLLSLAVSDFLVGFVLMPIQILFIGGCWVLGSFVCGLFYYASFILTSASVGNMVLISVDRYVAICDPLQYPTKVTPRRVRVCVCLCWAFSVFYNGLIDFLKYPEKYSSCYGECLVVVNSPEAAVDLVVTFLGPFLIITVLYMRVFVVAVTQARAMRSRVASVPQQRSGTVIAKKSELKAARTLGVVVLAFLLCSCPYYCFTVAADYNLPGSSTGAAELWLLYFNSCLNPVIYALCYPWFRRSIKHILTLQILQPGSREANIL